MKLKLPKKYRRYFEKWEWGLIEGFICGFIFFIFLNPPNPLLIVLLMVQILNTIILLSWKPVKKSKAVKQPPRTKKTGVPPPPF